MVVQIKYLGETLRNDTPISITSARLIRKISSLKDNNSNLHEYFDKELNDLQIFNTDITLEYDKNLHELYSVVLLNMKVDPGEEQLALLVEEVAGQLSDGYGEEPWTLRSLMGSISLHLIGVGGVSPLSVKKASEKSEFSTEKQSSKLNTINEKGRTQLTEAIYLNRDRLALKLIDKGADVNLTNPLTAACQKSVEKLAKKLIKKGANVNEEVHNLDNQGSETPLMWASNRGDLKIIDMLLGSGAEINFRNAQGRTALFYSKKPEVVELLLKRGANKSILDNDSKSAKEIVEISLEDELNYEWKDNEKVENYKKIIKLLNQ